MSNQQPQVGTIVRIGIFLRLPDGTLKIMLEGISRVRINEYVEMDNYLGARVEPLENCCARVTFAEPQWAITPGQAMVFYNGDVVLGGGTITDSGE